MGILRKRNSGRKSSGRRCGALYPSVFATPSCERISLSWTMRRIGRSTAWPTTGAGVRPSCRLGWAMAAFEYRQAQELRDALARWGVQYLFIGKSAAILLGFPDTTQDVDLFPLRSPENGQALVGALRELGFLLTIRKPARSLRARTSFSLRTDLSTWIWSSLRTALGDSQRLGNVTSRQRVSPYAIPMTSSPANRRQTVSETAKPFLGSSRSATTGCVNPGDTTLDREGAANCNRATSPIS